MIRKIDITNNKIAREVWHIQIPSYQMEAKLIDCYDIPPLQDTIETLQKCGEDFYGYYEHEELCGTISIKVENKLIDIHRLMIHPSHFRKGIAMMLLEHVENVIENAESIIVSTGSKNFPAIHLYERNGFRKTQVTKIYDQLSITSYKKMI